MPFIYALTEPTTGAVRYVGWADDPKGRLSRHLLDHSSTPKALWVRSLVEAGTRPGMVILEEVAKQFWADRERWWIAHFRTVLNIPLLNMTTGGQGGYGPKHNAESRARIGTATSARPGAWRGKKRAPLTDEWKAKLSASLKGHHGAMTGKTHPAETKAKIAESMRRDWIRRKAAQAV